MSVPSHQSDPIFSIGIVKLTHHQLRQPQDIVSRTTPEYSMGRLAARQPVNLTMPNSRFIWLRRRVYLPPLLL